MTKTIAVWGNCGAGKSLLTCAIANKLTAHGKSVLVINSDKVTPMLGTYLPFLEEKEAYSIGTLLSGNQISIQSFKNKIHLHKSNDNLGFMGLCKGENSLVYQMKKLLQSLMNSIRISFVHLVKMHCELAITYLSNMQSKSTLNQSERLKGNFSTRSLQMIINQIRNHTHPNSLRRQKKYIMKRSAKIKTLFIHSIGRYVKLWMRH